ncbi:hypothetical protein BDZ88DRAFT_161901, partial [Geranomyces variabilis]
MYRPSQSPSYCSKNERQWYSRRARPHSDCRAGGTSRQACSWRPSRTSRHRCRRHFVPRRRRRRGRRRSIARRSASNDGRRYGSWRSTSSRHHSRTFNTPFHHRRRVRQWFRQARVKARLESRRIVNRAWTVRLGCSSRRACGSRERPSRRHAIDTFLETRVGVADIVDCKAVAVTNDVLAGSGQWAGRDGREQDNDDQRESVGAAKAERGLGSHFRLVYSGEGVIVQIWYTGISRCLASSVCADEEKRENPSPLRTPFIFCSHRPPGNRSRGPD